MSLLNIYRVDASRAYLCCSDWKTTALSQTTIKNFRSWFLHFDLNVIPLAYPPSQIPIIQRILNSHKCRVLTGKRRYYGGDGERHYNGRAGNRLGHCARQHVHSASQRGAGAQRGQVEECQHSVQLFFTRLVGVGLLPRQRPCQRVRLSISNSQQIIQNGLSSQETVYLHFSSRSQ